MIFRVVQFSSRLVLLVLALAFIRTADAQKQSTRSPHGPLAIPCENCHTNSSWTPIRAIPEFSHDSTRYPLRGMHEKVSCTQCHIKPVFTDVGKNCADCHADIHRRQMGANCAQCHTVSGWNVANQSIKEHFNRFPLLGAHAVVQCDECHKSAAVGQFLGLSTNCDSCHMKDWQNTTAPAHATARSEFPPDQCQQCHGSFDTWFGATVLHDQPPISFKLTLGHAVPCEQCHVGGNYNLHIAANQCGTSGCHLITWQQTNAPPHSTAGPSFGLANCNNCHTPAGWTAPFDHSASATGFALVGTHMSTPCTSCHVNNNYVSLPTDCYGCHQAVFQSTTTPNHVTAGFPTTSAACATCHTITTWSAGVFDHSATGFVLTNGHANVACNLCHIGNNYALKISPTDCGNSGCHLTTWQQTNNPVHSTAGAQFAEANCSVCHNTVSWTTAAFDHTATGFPLTNAHANVDCASCHISNNYNLKTALNSCGDSGCHLTTWNQTNNPVHSTAGTQFAVGNCAVCHNTVSWTTAAFDHNQTGFALTGMHVSPVPTPCVSCHVSNNYLLNSAACYGCHIAAWQSTATLAGNVPNHITAGFPQDCSICHSTTNWTGSTFNHSTTGFALTGMHVSPTPTPCISCHLSNNYTLNSAACYGCHIVAWQSTATIGGSVPNHITSGYPQNCESCHTTTSWLGATFNHNATRFPLTGAHTTVACTLCHLTAAPPPLDCYSCHTAAWQSTMTLGGMVPNHLAVDAAAALITTNCITCHNTTSWLGATFTHSWFNVNHGNAGGVCVACHMNTVGAAASYTVFQCTQCHGGNNAANFRHSNVSGYVYSSPVCYACHKNGGG